jgi:acetylornithine deacetylase/succinyl-diaminopimelate desuccinylase-like protein
MTPKIANKALFCLLFCPMLLNAFELSRSVPYEIFKGVMGIRGGREVAEFLAERFRGGGFAGEDVRILPLENTASLVVRYRGTGKGGRPILILGHMDVVEARAEDWKRDPFKLTEENGYYFGRGTADNKSEVAAITATFLKLRSEQFVPTRDLIIFFTGDEETGMNTARDVVTRHRDLVDAEFALNGDGGGGALDEETGKPAVYYVQGAEKSYATFELTARNPGGHSAQPRIDNAIYDLADALKAVQGYRFPVMWNEWSLGSLRGAAAATPGKIGDALLRFAADPRDTAAAGLIADNPANVGRTRTTCVATRLSGGHADNALPQSATATVNCRIFPGMGADEVKATLQRLAGPKIEVTQLGNPQPGGSSPLRPDVMAAVTKAVHASYPGVPLVPEMATYATDGSVCRAAGIPTYGVSGLFLKESEDFSHGLDERIPVRSFEAEPGHWYVLLKALAGNP